MASSLRKLLPVLLLALAAVLAAACGSDEQAKSVPAGAVALVGDEPIEKADLDRLLAQAKKNYEAQKQDFPEVGTPEYETLKCTLLKGLVQQSQWEQAGAEMGVTVSDKEIDTRLEALKQQYFKGDEEKFQAQLDKDGLTVEQIRDQLRARMLSDKIYKSVIDKVKVTDAEIKAYYDNHKAQYMQPESREVRHIVVKKKVARRRALREAQERRRLRAARQEVHRGRRRRRRTAASSRRTRGRRLARSTSSSSRRRSASSRNPIKTEFGWHVIEVLSEAKPAAAQPLAEAKDTISGTLLQEQQNAALKKWVRDARVQVRRRRTRPDMHRRRPATGAGTSTG